VTAYVETARLRLRYLIPDDEHMLLALHADPAVMRHLGPPATEVDMSFSTDVYERHPGFGYRAAIEKATGAFLGWFLFRPPRENPPPGTIELGYRLHTAAWGAGSPRRARPRCWTRVSPSSASSGSSPTRWP
jgi:RimJ/RimL family protein N-acetyltransferase